MTTNVAGMTGSVNTTVPSESMVFSAWATAALWTAGSSTLIKITGARLNRKNWEYIGSQSVYLFQSSE